MVESVDHREECAIPAIGYQAWIPSLWDAGSLEVNLIVVRVGSHAEFWLGLSFGYVCFKVSVLFRDAIDVDEREEDIRHSS